MTDGASRCPQDILPGCGRGASFGVAPASLPVGQCAPFMDTPATTPTRRALANAIRALSMDAVQAANSGHPGAPMGMADIAEVLWRDVLKHNPGNPEMVEPRPLRALERPRLDAAVLAAAPHGLSAPHRGAQEIPPARLAVTAGHPERDLDIGIETTTGPLGQGFANAVGMALAEKLLAAQYNRDGAAIVDHHTYCFVGDGCLMEGISHEAASFAGHLKLGKLIVFYDDNGISHRRQDRGLVQRRHAEALRSLRLARGEERRRPRCRRGRRRHQEGAGTARISRRSSAARPSSAGARLTSRAPSRRTAKRSAPMKSRTRARRSAGNRRRS